MPDMLVKLYELPSSETITLACAEHGIELRRAMAPDKFRIVEWVKQNSNQNAEGECDVCFSKTPISCFIATSGKSIVGYACYIGGVGSAAFYEKSVGAVLIPGSTPGVYRDFLGGGGGCSNESRFRFVNNAAARKAHKSAPSAGVIQGILIETELPAPLRRLTRWEKQRS